ncbi:MAG: hypothetical protein JWN80_2179 [Microbacteriaceae bacterium]|nr:hypothetical protein [Microbacteriaceae bacterium]
MPVDNVPLREAVASFAAKPEQASYDDVVKEAATLPMPDWSSTRQDRGWR